MAQSKGIRGRDRNIFSYYGVIQSVTDPTQVIVGGNSMVVRKMVIVCEDYKGYRRSSVLMFVPRKFEHERLLKMVENKVFAKFRFCISMKEGRGGYYNNLFCLSIEPTRKKYAYLRQEIKYDPYVQRKEKRYNEIQVDNEGYVFPYNY